MKIQAIFYVTSPHNFIPRYDWKKTNKIDNSTQEKHSLKYVQ